MGAFFERRRLAPVHRFDAVVFAVFTPPADDAEAEHHTAHQERNHDTEVVIPGAHSVAIECGPQLDHEPSGEQSGAEEQGAEDAAQNEALCIVQHDVSPREGSKDEFHWGVLYHYFVTSVNYYPGNAKNPYTIRVFSI